MVPERRPKAAFSTSTSTRVRTSAPSGRRREVSFRLPSPRTPRRSTESRPRRSIRRGVSGSGGARRVSARGTTPGALAAPCSSLLGSTPIERARNAPGGTPSSIRAEREPGSHSGSCSTAAHGISVGSTSWSRYPKSDGGSPLLARASLASSVPRGRALSVPSVPLLKERRFQRFMITLPVSIDSLPSEKRTFFGAKAPPESDATLRPKPPPGARVCGRGSPGPFRPARRGFRPTW